VKEVRAQSEDTVWLKRALNGCGCAARIGCVERKTVDETSSATIKRNTQPSDWLVIKV